jgi:hypothetical protein
MLLVIGSAVLVLYSAALAWQFQTALNSAGIDALGLFGTFGLASLRAVRIVVLDHTAVMWALQRLLILCSALIMALIGIALLPKRARGTSDLGARNVSALPEEGDQ